MIERSEKQKMILDYLKSEKLLHRKLLSSDEWKCLGLCVSFVGYNRQNMSLEYLTSANSFVANMIKKLKMYGEEERLKVAVLYGGTKHGIDAIVEDICLKNFVPLVAVNYNIRYIPDAEALPPLYLFDKKEDYLKSYHQRLRTIFITGGGENIMENISYAMRYGVEVVLKDCARSTPSHDRLNNISNAAKIAADYFIGKNYVTYL